jgi:hypothetical protein
MIKADQYKIDFDSMEWEVSADGVRFKAYEQEGRKVVMVAKGELIELFRRIGDM